MRALFFLILFAGFLSGCTNSQPEISKSVNIDAISFNGKAIANAKVSSTPTCNAGISVPGQCDPRLIKFEASLDNGATWISVPGSDSDCSDGRFTLELADACASLGVATGATVTKDILLRGETGLWKEEGRSLRVSFAPAPVLSLSVANTMFEGAPLIFTATLSAPADGPVTVNYAATDGTAKAGEDYTNGSGSLVIEQGKTSVSFAVTTVSDGVYEGASEDFTMTISSPSAVQLGTSSLVGVIRDFDLAPSVRMFTSAKNVNESSGSVFVEIRSDKPSVKPLNISYKIAGGTATTADHGLAAGTVTIPELATSASIEVPIKEDLLVEGTETLIVELDADLNSVGSIDAAAKTTTLSIIDNDYPFYSIDNVTGVEGSGLTFTVTLSTAPTGNVSVDYATVNGTAVVGTNFVAKAGTLNFTPAVLTNTFTVSGLDVADVCADDKTFSVVLANPVGPATIGVGTGTGTFTDPDRPTVSIAASSASEGDTMSAVVSLSAVCSNHDVRFDWAMSHNTTETDDVALLSGTGVISRGASNTTLQVTSAEDSTDEVDEDFTITLSNTQEAVLGAHQALFTILDDDDPPVATLDSDVSVTEGQIARFTVTLSEASEKTVTVPLSINFTVTGAAAGAGDLGSYPAGVTFTAGQTTANFDVPTIGNIIDDPNRSFNVVMGSPTNATPGETTAVKGTIIDDDGAPTVSVAVSSPNVIEGGSVSFDVSVPSTAANAFTVAYTITGSVSGTDYTTGGTGTLSFTSSDLSKTVTVNVTDDTVEEPAETLIFTITGVTGAGTPPTIGNASATTTIAPSDVAAPTSLILAGGLKAIDLLATPSITVGGLTGTSTIVIYKDASCTSSVGSGVTTASSMTLASSSLSEGIYEFHAKRTAYGIQSPCSTASVSYHYLKLQVAETYATKTNWNDYVTTGSATDCSPATVGPPSSCVHAGERREVVMPGFADCTGLYVSDALGAFDWKCVEGAPIKFVTSGLKPHVRLADLIAVGGANPVWKTASVSLYKNKDKVLTGPATTWWTNQLRYLTVTSPPNFVAGNSGYIYVTNAATTSLATLQITASKVGIVIRPGQALVYNGSNALNCKTASSAVLNSICLVYANGQNFLWFEGDTDGLSSNNYTTLDFNVYLNGVKFSRVRNSKIYFSAMSGLSLNGSSSNTISNVRLASHSWVDGGGSGIAIAGASNDNVVSEVFAQRNNNSTSPGNTGAGIKIQAASKRNIISRVLSVNNGEHGIFFNDGSSNNVLSHFTVANNGNGNNSASGLRFKNLSDANIVTQGFVANNYYAGIELDGSDANEFSQIHSQPSADNSFSYAFRLLNAFDTLFDYVIAANKCSSSNSTSMSSSCAVAPSYTSTGTVTRTNDAISGTTDAIFGPQFTADYANPVTSTNGLMSTSANSVASILEFRNPYRGWGAPGNGNFSSSHRGVCSTPSCRVWDYSVNPLLASVLNNANGSFVAGGACPSSVDGNSTAVQSGSIPFLLNARELLADGIGDDDGLCESNEACAFSPHRGAYQSMTDPVQGPTCTFANGAVSGVTMYGAYPTTLDGDLANSAAKIAVSETQTLAKRFAATGAATSVRALSGKTSGKWYFEATLAEGTFSTSAGAQVGVGAAVLNGMVGAAGGYAFDLGTLAVYQNGTSTSSGLASLAVGDTIGIAVDLNSNQMWFSVNGAWLGGGSPSTGSSPTIPTFSRSAAFFPAISLITQGTAIRANFGQTQFRSPVPTGFNPGWY